MTARCSSRPRSVACSSTRRSRRTSRSRTCLVRKRDVTEIVGELVELYTKAEVATSLDKLKELGFEYSTRAGLTISISDVRTPAAKAEILDKHEKDAEKVEQQYDRGIITDDERRQKEIEIWTDATNQVTEAMQVELVAKQFNPIEMMVGSGARGNVMQVRQIAGMRGLVANPRGEIIPRPIKSNFREGLSVLEYFISTHGARKGLADTALRTADSGYLTRRLVDVAQELIVRDPDCGSIRGIWVEDVLDDPEHARLLENRLLSRCLSEDVTLAGRHGVPAQHGDHRRRARACSSRTRRSPGCACARCSRASSRGTSPAPRTPHRRPRTRRASRSTRPASAALCYGTMLATGKLVELGEAVGIIAAQSIGEPGTQLTMRTFHTGGVAGEDITHGLPRVVELFEARTPKGAALLAESSGVVRIGENEKGERTLTIVADDGTEELHAVSMRTHLAPGLVDGAEVVAGAQLTGDVKTPRDPKKILDIDGIRTTQKYLGDEVQKVYREQGVSIHDKHVEVIVRQMLRRVAVSEPGDSEFLPGQKADAREFANVNKRLVAEGKRPAEGRPELMGITKASLATESWLSAASFQETTRVLTEAAIEGKNDGLEGLKENVIIGKLIPAGTGMPQYRDVGTEAPDYQPLPFYTSDYEDDLDLAERLRASLEAQTRAEDAVDPRGRAGARGAEPGRGRRGRGGGPAAGRGADPARGRRRRSAIEAADVDDRDRHPGGDRRRGIECLPPGPGLVYPLRSASCRLGGPRPRPGDPCRPTAPEPAPIHRKFATAAPRKHQGVLCPRSPSSSARGGRARPRSPRRPRSGDPRSAAACARACSRPRPRSRTRRCARSPACA